MYAITVYTFIQSGLQPGTMAGDLSIANQIGLAVVLICIGLLVLMFSHYYRMAGSRDKQIKNGKENYNPVAQFEYMSREDLKAMILKEKASREKAEDETGNTISNDTKPEVQEAVQGRLFDLSEVPSESLPAATQETSTDADLIAKLILPSQVDIEKAKEEEEAIKPKREGHKYIDKVERSLLSNESPEEFKQRSRKI
ncbi:MAG: hypothetical protein NTY09_09160 [bacterium]|nr:hypothetical protein [bacterium]